MTQEKKKTTEAIIEEFQMEKCVFDRDTLFSFVVFRDRLYADIVK